MITHRNALVLVLAASLAATPALALPNTGAYNRSSEAFKKTTFQDLCQHVADEADGIEQANRDSPLPPDKIRWAQAKQAAEQVRDKGRAAGCRI